MNYRFLKIFLFGSVVFLRLLIISLLVLITIATSAQSGTKVTSSIVPNSFLDNYPTHQAKFGKGGYRSVSTLAERDAILSSRRDTGMLVYVIASDKIYTLKNGLANGNWEEFKVGSESSTDTVVYTRNGQSITTAGYTYTFRTGGANTNYSAFINTYDAGGNAVDARFTKANNSITVYPAVNCSLDALIVLKSFQPGGGSGGGSTVIDTAKIATVFSLGDTAKNIRASIGLSSGTVTSVSIDSKNGISGTVQNATTTPSIILKIDSLHLDVPKKNSDTITFFGTSISSGVGASTLNYRFPTQISQRLHTVEKNCSQSGSSMWDYGVSQTNLNKIPKYSKYHRWLIIEYGVNDMQLGITDTTTFKTSYLRFLDTCLINRGWPANKIIMLTPSYVTPNATATVQRQEAFNKVTKTISALKSTQLIDVYAKQLPVVSNYWSSDGLHPNNQMVNYAYVTPIVTLLGDSVKLSNQKIAVNGTPDFQNLKITQVKPARYGNLVLGLDSVGNVVAYDMNGIIRNMQLNPNEPQLATINVGNAYFGGVTAPTSAEKVQVNGAIKAGYARFISAAPANLTGAGIEIGYLTNQGWIFAYDRTNNSAKDLYFQGIGAGKSIFAGKIEAPGISASSYGQFSGGGPSDGLGVEIFTYNGMGIIEGRNRNSGNVAMDLIFQGLGGNGYFGSLTAIGSNRWQFTGSGHFTTKLNVGSTATPDSSFATNGLQARGGKFTGSVYSKDNKIGVVNSVTIDTTYGVRLNGSATVWEDIDFPIIIRNTGTNIPTLATTQGNLTSPQWAVNDFAVCEKKEIPHAAKIGATTYQWHIHLETGGTNVDNRYVAFEIEWNWANNGAAFSVPATISSGDLLIPANTPANTHLVFNIGSAFGLTGQTLGAHIKTRLKRVTSTGTAPTANPFCEMLQIHYERDSEGSSTITTK